jgi:hypothetical protein
MTNLWLKIRIWTKVVVFSAVGLYALAFVVSNWDVHVPRVTIPLITAYYDVPLLTVLLMTAVVSVVGTWLLGTIVRTVRQLKDMRSRGRTAKLEKEMAQMKAKAGMLQTKAPEPVAPAKPAAMDDDDEDEE